MSQVKKKLTLHTRLKFISKLSFYTHLHIYIQRSIQQASETNFKRRICEPSLTSVPTHNHCTTLSLVHITSSTHLLTQPCTNTLEMQTLTRSPKCCTNKSVDSANGKPNERIRNFSNTHSLKNKHPHEFTPLELKKTLWNVIKRHLLHHLCSVRGREGGRAGGGVSVGGGGGATINSETEAVGRRARH